MSIQNCVTVYKAKRRRTSNEAEGDRPIIDKEGSGASGGQEFQLIEKKGDLFSCSEKESLAHCVSADIAMGKGIAVLFKKKFGGILELKNQGQKPGGVATLKREERFIYYLITKDKYWQKPTYDSLRSSLEAMRDHCVTNGVCSACMPRIGCGLDGLQWPKVTEIIKDVFIHTEIKVTVYAL